MDPQGFDIFHAGSGCSVSPRQLAESMLQVAAIEKRVVSRGGVRQDEVLETVADVGKAKRVLGWQSRMSPA
jgi:nucleoside-diphosphate-sugar epimerase